MKSYDMGKKMYSKDWCQGFCTYCGTHCAEHSQAIYDLKEENAALKQVLEHITSKMEELTNALSRRGR